MHVPADRTRDWRLAILRGYLWVAVAAHPPAALVPVVLGAPADEVRGHLGLLGLSALLHGTLLALAYAATRAHRSLGFALSLMQLVALTAIALNAAPEARPGVLVAFSVVPVLAVFVSGRWAGLAAWVLAMASLAALAMTLPDRATGSILAGTALVAGLLTGVTTVAERERARWEVRASQAQEQLRDALVEAERAGHAKETFLATMSHEIRTPLNGVLGLAEALLDTRLDTEQQRLATTVLSSGKLLKRVLDDVLDLARMNAGELGLNPQPLRLRSLVDDVLALHGSRASTKGLTLDARLDEGLPDWVTADDMRLSQVLGNLISNALKFTESGGVQVRVLPAAGGTRFEVIDTGIGIDAETAEQLFDPFVQANERVQRAYGGTGLGLAISARIVQQMNGRIGAEPLNNGSRFWFELPLPDADPREISSSDEDGLEGLVVLVAEDNPVNQLVARKMLEQLGATVVLADDGLEAVEVAKREHIDVILMDGQMPELDGYDATRRIRALEGSEQLPIVALTAAVTPQDTQRALEAGMDEVLAKPIDRAAVVRAIDAALVARGRRVAHTRPDPDDAESGRTRAG